MSSIVEKYVVALKGGRSFVIQADAVGFQRLKEMFKTIKTPQDRVLIHLDGLALELTEVAAVYPYQDDMENFNKGKE